MKTCSGYSIETPRWGVSYEYPQHRSFLWRNKKKKTCICNIWIPPLIWELSINTWRAKIKMNIFSTSRLLVENKSVLQNRWSTMKFGPIRNTNCHINYNLQHIKLLFNPVIRGALSQTSDNHMQTAEAQSFAWSSAQYDQGICCLESTQQHLTFL